MAWDASSPFIETTCCSGCPAMYSSRSASRISGETSPTHRMHGPPGSDVNTCPPMARMDLSSATSTFKPTSM